MKSVKKKIGHNNYWVGWYKEAGLNIFQRYKRLHAIGRTIHHGGDPEQIDREFFEKWYAPKTLLEESDKK